MTTHFPNIEFDVATYLAAHVAGLVLNTNVFGGKERPGVRPAVFCQVYGGEPPSLDDADVESLPYVQVLLIGTIQNYKSVESLARTCMAALHLKTDIVATDVTVGKPTTYMDCHVLDPTPQALGPNAAEMDRLAFNIRLVYAD